MHQPVATPNELSRPLKATLAAQALHYSGSHHSQNNVTPAPPSVRFLSGRLKSLGVATG